MKENEKLLRLRLRLKSFESATPPKEEKYLINFPPTSSWNASESLVNQVLGLLLGSSIEVVKTSNSNRRSKLPKLWFLKF